MIGEPSGKRLDVRGQLLETGASAHGFNDHGGSAAEPGVHGGVRSHGGDGEVGGGSKPTPTTEYGAFSSTKGKLNDYSQCCIKIS